MTPRDLLTNYPSFPTIGGGGRIRTFEGVSRQIYSLLPLAAWVPLPEKTSRVFSLRPPGVSTALARLLLRPGWPSGGPHPAHPADTSIYACLGPQIRQPGPRVVDFAQRRRSALFPASAEVDVGALYEDVGFHKSLSPAFVVLLCRGRGLYLLQGSPLADQLADPLAHHHQHVVVGLQIRLAN